MSSPEGRASDYIWKPSNRYLHLDGLASIDLQDWKGAVEHRVAPGRRGTLLG